MTSVLKVDNIQNSSGTSALSIDSSGRVTQPAKPAFSAHGDDWFSLSSANSWIKISGFDTERFDIGGNYNTSNQEFTVPVDGIYMVVLRAWLEGSVDSANYLRIRLNGTSSLAEVGENLNNNDDHTIQAVVLESLSAGDVITPEGRRSVIHATNDIFLGKHYAEFSAILMA